MMQVSTVKPPGRTVAAVRQGRWLGACLVMLAMLGLGPRVWAQTCGAAGGDNRPAEKTDCGDSVDPASHPSTEPATGTGNSIDLVTGNKYLHETDAAWPDGLVLKRHYNSRNPFVHSLGVAWTHGFETTLVRTPQAPLRASGRASRRSVVELQVIQADGRRLVFRAIREPTQDRRVLRFRAVDATYGSLFEQPDAATDRRYQWRWRNGQVLSFDADGRLSAVESPYGLSIALHYHPSTRVLERVETRSGLALRFEYYNRADLLRNLAGAAAGRLAAVVQPDGTRIRYRYDAQGLLAEVLHPSGENSRLTYDDPATPHAVTRWTDGEGRVRGDYRYDQQGRAVYSSKADGVEAVWLAYRLPARAGDPGETHVVDSMGHASVFGWRYDLHTHRAMLLSASGAGCAACPPVGASRRYDKDLRLVEESLDEGRLRVARIHDRVGRLIELRTLPVTPSSPFVRYQYQGADPDALVAAIEYPSIAAGRLRRVLFARDAHGRITERVETGFTPDLQTLGPELAPTRWHPIERRIAFRWIDDGPARGRLAAIDGPLPGVGDTVRHDYDARGWLIATHRPEGLTDRYVPDRYGRVREHVDAGGVVNRFEYDATGSLMAVERAGLRTFIDYSRGVRNPVITSPARGAMQFRFDDAGRMVAVTDADGGRFEVDYDTENQAVRTRVLKVVDGRLLRLVDLNPREMPQTPTPTAWGSAGSKLIRTADGRTKFSVGGESRAIWSTDDFGQLVAEVGVDYGIQLHRYDASGLRVSSVDDRGTVVVRRFDLLGRVVSQGTPLDPLKIQYRYQGVALRWRSDPNQTTAYVYDGLGRVIAEGTIVGPRSDPRKARLLVRTMTLDDQGRLAGETIPGGHSLKYAYTNSGAMKSVNYLSPSGQQQGLISTLEWIPFSAEDRGLMKFHGGNGIRTEYDYDLMGRIQAVRHAGQPVAGSSLPQSTLHYDQRGQIASIDSGFTHAAFAYDDDGRLVGAAKATSTGPQVKVRAEGFAYDRLGNRVSAVHGARTTTAKDEAAAWAFESPKLGASAVAEAIHGFGYRFNSKGERIEKIHSGKASTLDRIFLHVGGRLRAELDAEGNLVRWFILLGDRPVAVVARNEQGSYRVLWLHSDHIGTYQAATDGAGRLIETVEYTAFGADPSAVDQHDKRQPVRPGIVPLRMPGQYLDEETGLFYNNRRTYDPMLGKFTTPDPLGVAAGTNAYAYAALDPIRLSDPSGLAQQDIHFYMVYFLARVSGLSERASLTVAQASQFVDDNLATEPFPNGEDGVPSQTRRLALYHFTQGDSDPPRRQGESDEEYARRRVRNPQNPQLAVLLSYANRNLRTTESAAGASPCTRMQLFGEYLHPFVDTYFHRNNLNAPFPIDGGIGHGLYGANPDYTYNNNGPWGLSYRLNEYRAYQAERAVMAEIKRNFGTEAVDRDGFPISIDRVSATLVQFNAIQESECRLRDCLQSKVALLDSELQALGLGTMPRYDVNAARDARIRNLSGLNQDMYPGAILQTR